MKLPENTQESALGYWDGKDIFKTQKAHVGKKYKQTEVSTPNLSNKGNSVYSKTQRIGGNICKLYLTMGKFQEYARTQ